LEKEARFQMNKDKVMSDIDKLVNWYESNKPNVIARIKVAITPDELAKILNDRTKPTPSEFFYRGKILVPNEKK
jgi:hypothetical protein